MELDLAEKKFDEMFFPEVDDNDRAYTIGDKISVRAVHDWNWDGFMNQAVLYGFINYWERWGYSQAKCYEEGSGKMKWIYKGLRICYERIKNNPEKFLDMDAGYSFDDEKLYFGTIEFIWKYRGCMWI